MKINILIYEKNRDTLNFLKDYFEENKDLKPYFVKDLRELKNLAEKNRFDLLIIQSPEGLKHLKKIDIKSPVIGIISTRKTEGIRTAVSLNIDNFIIKPFDKDDFNHKLRTVINRNKWLKQLFLKKKDLETLIELLYIISSTLNPSEVLYLIVKKIADMIDVTRCSIVSIDPVDGKTATVVSSYEDPAIKNIKIDLKKYPEIRKALEIKETVIIEDALKDPLMKDVLELIRPLGIKSIIVIPIIFRNEIIGTLFLRTSRKSIPFNKREINFCIAFANISANPLYNAYLYEKMKKESYRLEKLAITDYLTGLYNVRYFYNRLREEFSRAKRYNLHLSCIMLDIDHFKRINDTYGHRVGDIVLREFSQLLKRHIRKSDVLARYGGEEFILLLPNTALDGAVTKAEYLRKITKEHRFKILKDGDSITISIGIVSSSSKKVKTEDDLITFSDSALFQAKQRGRDNVIVFK